MKIKSIAAICKKGKQVVLYNRYESGGTLQQYIGDGMAAYPVSGLPELDEESILTIFEVPEKQREDWFVRVRDVPEGINFEDTDANEKMIERDNLSIIFSGHTLKPLQTRRGLVFIQSRYLSPVSDVLDVLELYERFTPNGTPYIVAKAGFLLQAVIMPYDVINAGFVERLQRLARDCAFALDLRRQEEEQAAFLAQQPITHNGIEYRCISGLIYRLQGGKTVLKLELEDKCLHSVTIADPERVTLAGNARLQEGGEE